MIHIVDYGLGNVQAFSNVFKRLGVESVACRSPRELRAAEKIILPGVGSFDQAMTLLDASGMRPVLDNLVLDRGVPVLGICVGMQMLAIQSDEGILPGLGWLDGHVRVFQVDPTPQLPTPHMGWNDVRPRPSSPLFDGLRDEARFYFLHSYYFDCAESALSSAQTEYGHVFSAAVEKENVFGVQFHPEKSHRWGVRLLQNFASL